MKVMEEAATREYQELLRNFRAGKFGTDAETDRILKSVGKSRDEFTRELAAELSTRQG
ncbi:MAG TPA: hypothetical protein VGM05_13080 [Planctomycetaceae bacterium]|jgi:hypothetical protein